MEIGIKMHDGVYYCMYMSISLFTISDLSERTRSWDNVKKILKCIEFLASVFPFKVFPWRMIMSTLTLRSLPFYQWTLFQLHSISWLLWGCDVMIKCRESTYATSRTYSGWSFTWIIHYIFSANIAVQHTNGALHFFSGWWYVHVPCRLCGYFLPCFVAKK